MKKKNENNVIQIKIQMDGQKHHFSRIDRHSWELLENLLHDSAYGTRTSFIRDMYEVDFGVKLEHLSDMDVFEQHKDRLLYVDREDWLRDKIRHFKNKRGNV